MSETGEKGMSMGIDYEKEADEFFDVAVQDAGAGAKWLRAHDAKVLRDAAKDKFEHMRPTEPFPDGGCFAMCGACRLEKLASWIESGGR